MCDVVVAPWDADAFAALDEEEEDAEADLLAWSASPKKERGQSPAGPPRNHPRRTEEPPVEVAAFEVAAVAELVAAAALVLELAEVVEPGCGTQKLSATRPGLRKTRPTIYDGHVGGGGCFGGGRCSSRGSGSDWEGRTRGPRGVSLGPPCQNARDSLVVVCVRGPRSVVVLDVTTAAVVVATAAGTVAPVVTAVVAAETAARRSARSPFLPPARVSFCLRTRRSCA